jgi:two-component system, OmpR family, response regulator
MPLICFSFCYGNESLRNERRLMRVLLIEDDVMIGKSLKIALNDSGISVDWLRDGASGLEAVKTGGHSIILLDLGLPELDGLKVLKAARASGTKTPVIVISARDDIATRIGGLDLGADDYIIKPFDADELLARIRAVVRRHIGQSQSSFTAGKVTLDTANHRVSYAGKEAVLPAREFALLVALAEHPGMILSKTQLEERLYGWGDEVESNAIDVLIYYIRQKFGKTIIRNLRGSGWMILKEKE